MKPTAMQAATRHSKRVRLARIAIIGLGLCGGLLIARDVASDLRRAERFAPSGRVTVDGTRIALKSLRVSGALRGGGLYKLGADLAQEDMAHPDLVELFHIEAMFDDASSNIVHLVAAHGRLDRRADTIALDGAIRATDAKGNVLVAKSVLMDYDTGAFKSVDFGSEIEDNPQLAMMFELLQAH